MYKTINDLQPQCLTPEGGLVQNKDINIANGICPLDSNAKVPSSKMPFNIYMRLSS